jgi:Tol biopolymer transport system component
METQPDWAPDGRHLYFASAPQITFSDTFTSERRYRDVRYDLMRVEYDPASGQWGKAEPVLTAAEAGGSLSGPKVSPDGRFLLFVMLDFGYFSLYSREADLYLMDLATRSYRRLDEVNSKESESFHAWSSNSRWFVFASRRRDGLCGLPYFAHVDEKGNASKAFLLPQKDPGLYEKQLKSFNIPILASAPVRQGWRRLAAAATGRCRNVNARLDSKVRVDAATGATP